MSEGGISGFAGVFSSTVIASRCIMYEGGSWFRTITVVISFGLGLGLSDEVTFT
jgi:hypothetical protein